MLTQRERTWSLLCISIITLSVGAVLSLLSEIAPVSSAFYIISTFAYGAGAILFVGSSTALIFNYARMSWFEGKLTAHMVAVGPEDRVFEIRQVGEAIVRAPVVGITTQVVTMAPGKKNAIVFSGDGASKE